jgi:hypothetical protein
MNVHIVASMHQVHNLEYHMDLKEQLHKDQEHLLINNRIHSIQLVNQPPCRLIIFSVDITFFPFILIK